MTSRRDPLDLRRALVAVAREQCGYFTAKQALDAGYSYQAQRHHVSRGNWVRVDRGIFRLPEWPACEHEDLVRWTLWSRSRGTVSHSTALAVHELGDVMPARVHLTVPPGFRAKSPAVVLHQGSLPSQDVEELEGFSVTTPLRSILDTAADDIEVDQLARVIDDALTRGVISKRTLRARADEFGPRAGLAIERALLQEAS
jgi:predicted transcriptional regulator of viral defense system